MERNLVIGVRPENWLKGRASVLELIGDAVVQRPGDVDLIARLLLIDGDDVSLVVPLCRRLERGLRR